MPHSSSSVLVRVTNLRGEILKQQPGGGPGLLVRRVGLRARGRRGGPGGGRGSFGTGQAGRRSSPQLVAPQLRLAQPQWGGGAGGRGRVGPGAGGQGALRGGGGWGLSSPKLVGLLDGCQGQGGAHNGTGGQCRVVIHALHLSKLNKNLRSLVKSKIWFGLKICGVSTK